MAEFRILVLRLGSMGDVIHTLPAVASLKHSFPHSHLTWLIRPRWMPLLAGNPCVDEIVPIERSVRASFAEARRLRARRFDLAVDFQGLIHTALLAAPRRPNKLTGFHRKQVRERLAALFYSSEVKTHADHIGEPNLELAPGAAASNLLRAPPLPPGAPEGIRPEGRFI